MESSTMNRQNVFVGRTDATKQLQAVLKGELASGSPATVCSIEGPGGIGKTALLQHALARVDLGALKYLLLSIDGGGAERSNVFNLASRLVDGAESGPTSKHPPGHFFPRTKRVLSVVADVLKECASEFNRVVADDEESQLNFKTLLDAAMAVGEAINRTLPSTKPWLDCSESSRRKIEEAIEKVHSLKPTLRWLGGILPDVWGVEQRNAVKANALNALSDALLVDLSAILSGYRGRDFLKPTHGKQEGS